MPRHELPLRSLGFATDIDVLPDSATVEDRGGYVVVRTPTNPTFYWGNFLLFREPPGKGDRERWEALFEAELGDEATRSSRHVTFGWDVVDGAAGAAQEEFCQAGYDLERSVTLSACRSDLHPHPRANRDVRIRRLDPAPGADADAWKAVVELDVALREPGHDEASHRLFTERSAEDRRRRLRAGDGGWFVAELEGEVVASCGVIVTFGRGRFQTVATAEAHRRTGIASRLVHDAGHVALESLGADRLVIVADPEYHAFSLYASLGFVPCETTAGVCWWPGAQNASLHPRRLAPASAGP